jgi:aconitate hydratase
MGQAPASGASSLRTFPRNFKGRSGTKDAQVYLASAEVAAASVLSGRITDPRTLGEAPKIAYPDNFFHSPGWFIQPPEDGKHVEILRGPNIKALPHFEAAPDDLDCEVILKVEDNITTDHIMPAGTRVLPFRSNIPKISEFVFDVVDETFFERAQKGERWAVVGGDNYGQGSSREHAALAPMYLGVKAVLAKSFARIHKANLINFGIVPVVFENPGDYGSVEEGDILEFPALRKELSSGAPITIHNTSKDTHFTGLAEIDERGTAVLLAGGLLAYTKQNVSD